MAVLCVLLPLVAALADPPAVEIDTLRGDRQTGRLVRIDSAAVRLRQGDEEALTVPMADVLELRIVKPSPPEPSNGPRVALVDGSQISCRDFRVSKDQAQLDTVCCGLVALPVARVSHVRFGISTAKLDEAWQALLTREAKGDLLVLRKEDVLDFLTGVAGDIRDKLGFLLDGEELQVPREKVYGVIFRRRAPAASKPVCQVKLAGGDVLHAAEVRADEAGLQISLVGGGELKLPLATVSALDYSAGKVVYLSQLEPRDVKYVPYFDLTWEYRRDRSLDGNPITVAGKSYSRGLAIHSKTTLRYRLAGEFDRLKAIAGIDDEVRSVGATVLLKISGDGKPLFEAPVSGRDPPRPLDLSVAGVRDLEILVDFGDDGGAMGDRLDLADAKLFK
ncbi:MAG: NPCBM/NEW2 domain-containing protein [Planctomycetaceae bacterium]